MFQFFRIKTFLMLSTSVFFFETSILKGEFLTEKYSIENVNTPLLLKTLKQGDSIEVELDKEKLVLSFHSVHTGSTSQNFPDHSTQEKHMRDGLNVSVYNTRQEAEASPEVLSSPYKHNLIKETLHATLGKKGDLIYKHMTYEVSSSQTVKPSSIQPNESESDIIKNQYQKARLFLKFFAKEAEGLSIGVGVDTAHVWITFDEKNFQRVWEIVMKELKEKIITGVEFVSINKCTPQGCSTYFSAVPKFYSSTPF